MGSRKLIDRWMAGAHQGEIDEAAYSEGYPDDRLDGARREGRTPTLLREPDFESGASASSAIRASLPQEHVFLA